MRAYLVACALMLSAGLPAQAHTGRNMTAVTFSGAIPCSVVCAYWVDNGFAPCENPFPPGSYADALTSPAPEPPAGRIVLIETTLDPQIDWDSFLCESEPPYREIAAGANILGEPCDWHSWPPMSLLPTGCHEDMSAPLRAGQTTIFRAYNWSDALDATGHYWFLTI